MVDGTRMNGEILSLSKKKNKAFGCILSRKFHPDGTVSSKNKLCVRDLQYSAGSDRSVLPRDHVTSMNTEPRNHSYHKRKKAARKQCTNPFQAVITHNAHDSVTGVRVDSQLNVQQIVEDDNETRITSLRKLLRFPLNIQTSAPSTKVLSSGENNVDSGTENLYESSLCLLADNPPKMDCEEKNQAGTSSSEYVERWQRRRSSETGKSVLNSTCQDEVNEKIAELARTPRIKSMDEILASLRIKVNMGDSNAINACSSQSNEYNSMSEHTNQNKCSGIKTECNTSYVSNLEEIHQKSNDVYREIPEQPTNSTEDTENSAKRIKILLSGEVSNRKKATYSSIGQPTSHHSTGSLSRSQKKIIQASDFDIKKQLEDEERNNRKILRRKQKKMLILKKVYGRTKDLKTVLHARTSYRKEIPSVQQDTCVPQILDLSYKKSNYKTEELISPRQLSTDQHDVPHSSDGCETFSQPRHFGNGEIILHKNMISNAEVKSPLPYNNHDSVSPMDFESSFEDDIDKEVAAIIKRLPPLKESDLCSQESQEYVPSVKSQQDIEDLANRMCDEPIEGVNGNFNRGTEKDTFSEWHETVVRPSYQRSLTLLPYVVID